MIGSPEAKDTKMQSKTKFWGGLPMKANAHRLRCKRLSPMQPGEAEHLVADFLASRGVTACPARYAAPVEQRTHLTRNHSL
jgi:hypothetical protein